MKTLFLPSLTLAAMSLFASCAKLLTDDEIVQPEEPKKEQITVFHAKLSESGQLPSIIDSTNSKNTITQLTVDGPINGTDLRYLREMAGADVHGNATEGKLSHLDLSNVSFVKGGESYFIYEDEDDGTLTPMTMQTNKVGCYAFGYCSQLQKLTLPDNITAFESQAFYKCESLDSLNMPSNLQSIGRSTFCYCEKLSTPIVFPEGTSCIQDFVCYECYCVPEIKLPSSVEHVGYASFSGCRKAVFNWDQSSFSTFEGYAFQSCSKLTDIKIPDGMKSIPEAAFNACSSLTSIDLPASVDSIQEYAFYASGLSGAYTIPKNVIFIGNYAFAKCDFTEIIIDHDIDIKPYSSYSQFHDCDKLKSVKVKEGVTVLDLQFTYCDFLESVSLPSTLQSIYYDAFSGSESLKSVDLPESLTLLGDYVFSSSGLMNLQLPCSLTSISNGLCRWCEDLTRVEMPDEITDIGICSFENCYSLDSVKLPGQLKDIRKNAFSNCTSLQSIEFPESLETIGPEAFFKCSALSSVVFPENCSIDTIPSSSFYFCKALTELILTDSIKYIGKYACSSIQIKSIELPKCLISIDEAAFLDCGYLENIVIPENVRSIGKSCFCNCRHLRKVVNLSPNPQVIDSSVFEGVPLNVATLYVLPESLALYKVADVWKDFKNIEAIE